MNEEKLTNFIEDYNLNLKKVGLSDLVTVNLNVSGKFNHNFNPNGCREITIRSIWSNFETGKGHATKALKLLIQMSNEYNVDLKLSVESLRHDAYDPKYNEKETNRLENLNENYLTDDQLLDWYRKSGFTPVNNESFDPETVYFMCHKSTFSIDKSLKKFITEKKDDNFIFDKNVTSYKRK